MASTAERSWYGSLSRPSAGGVSDSTYEVLQRRHSYSSDVSPPDRRASVLMDAPPEGSTELNTVINILKMCMGSGMLALPYAVVNGGYGFSAIGIVVIAAWNLYAIDRLLRCKALLDQSSRGAEDVDVHQMYAFLGRRALGDGGGLAVDLCIIITLYGVCVTYLITATQLLVDTPITLRSLSQHPHLDTLLHTLLCLVIVLPLSSARSLALLSYSSVAGLVSLAVAFIVILANGIASGAYRSVSLASIGLLTWPADWQAFSRFFGVAAFCFGVPPLTFPIQGSMRQPDSFPRVMGVALAVVALAYILLPGAVAIIYSPTRVQPNIIEVLPPNLMATLVRLSVALVCLLSYPLALVPLAQLIESLLRPCHIPSPPGQSRLGTSAQSHSHSNVPSFFHREQSALLDFERLKRGRASFFGQHLFLRFLLIISTAVCATALPCFGVMVGLMGAFTVTLISFVLPPLFHLSLFSSRLTRCQALVDLVMIALGLSACLGSTWLTLQSGIAAIFNGHKCS